MVELPELRLLDHRLHDVQPGQGPARPRPGRRPQRPGRPGRRTRGDLRRGRHLRAHRTQPLPHRLPAGPDDRLARGGPRRRARRVRRPVAARTRSRSSTSGPTTPSDTPTSSTTRTTSPRSATGSATCCCCPRTSTRPTATSPTPTSCEHYFGQNLLARSLHPNAYQHNPTFLALIERTGLPFQRHPGPVHLREHRRAAGPVPAHLRAGVGPAALGLDGGTAAGSRGTTTSSFGQGEHRNWDDARTYGFVSAGGGRWYSQPLQLLKPGDRVFAYAPGHGYVGVGLVQDTAKPASQLEVTGADGTSGPLRGQPVHAPNMWEHEADPVRAEYAVPVTWQVTRDVDDALWKPGWFANQTTACRLRNPELVERPGHSLRNRGLTISRPRPAFSTRHRAWRAPRQRPPERRKPDDA